MQLALSDHKADEDEMLQIQGIEPDKVRRYGKKFLKLIRDHYNQYQSIMANDEDMRFDKPVDPNHHDVVILSSDEEGDIDNSGDSNSAKRRGRFPLGPEVEAFNSQCRSTSFRRLFSANDRLVAKSAHPPAPPPINFTGRDGGPRGGARGHARGNMKKSGRRPSRAGSLAANAKGGVQKKSTNDFGRRTSSGSWNNASAFSAYGRNPGGPSKRGEGSRHGMFKANSSRSGRGIGMMPI
jgi:bloom syndrome protein